MSHTPTVQTSHEKSARPIDTILGKPHVLTRIFRHCDTVTVLAAARVCKDFARAAARPVIYRHLKIFKPNTPDPLRGTEWAPNDPWLPHSLWPAKIDALKYVQVVTVQSHFRYRHAHHMRPLALPDLEVLRVGQTRQHANSILCSPCEAITKSFRCCFLAHVHTKHLVLHQTSDKDPVLGHTPIHATHLTLVLTSTDYRFFEFNAIPSVKHIDIILNADTDGDVVLRGHLAFEPFMPIGALCLLSNCPIVLIGMERYFTFPSGSLRPHQLDAKRMVRSMLAKSHASIPSAEDQPVRDPDDALLDISYMSLGEYFGEDRKAHWSLLLRDGRGGCSDDHTSRVKELCSWSPSSRLARPNFCSRRMKMDSTSWNMHVSPAPRVRETTGWSR